MKLFEKARRYARLVRFSHTVFAMPFAMASVALAWPRHPVTLRTLFWIILAMVGARTAAMGFNRLADRKFDALNPRTRSWELPSGAVKPREAIVLTLFSALVFVIAAYQLNWICFVLSPLALALFGAQRFTSLGYALNPTFAGPQDAIESVRQMCRWVVCEDCDPAVTPALWEGGLLCAQKAA